MREKKNKGGRPPVNIDRNDFEKLCALQCTQKEIINWFGVTDKTLTNWIKRTYGKEYSFSDIYAQKRSIGKISLRRTLWKKAEKSAAVAIWLSKQHLGMTDKVEQKIEGAPERLVIKIEEDE